MATTCRDLITDTLVDIGVLAAGEVATAADADFALRKLNRMVDTWKTERLTVYTITRTVKALTASDAEYSVGSGGDINIDRPIFIDRINLLDTAADPDTETPLGRLTESEYAAIPQKAQTADRPSSWYYNPTYTSARGTLTLWPVQTGSYSIVLHVPTPTVEFATLNTDIALPPGYREMLSSNLAIRLMSSYKMPQDPVLLKIADETKATVKRANRRVRDQSFDAGACVYNGGGVSYDLITDRIL